MFTIMNPTKHHRESMLRESIKYFLTSYHNGSSDYSSFETIFFRLIQTMLDPPLEITWFYAAVTYHTARRNNPPSRVLIAKDLLNLLTRCSNLSSASKKIALLAPVVYDLYSIVCNNRETEMHERMEAGKLVENMIRYVMITAGAYDYGNEDTEGDNPVVFFEDLVRVWTTDRGGGNCHFVETLRMFFPLLSDEIGKRMNPSCGVRELVGIVLLEVFLLRLYMSLSSGMCTDNVLKDTRDQVVQSITGFQNCYFLDMLLEMLSGPSLPVAASMSYEDAVLLRKVLYDATILVDYSSYSGRWVQTSASQLKKLALAWVVAADHAIQFARAAIDQSQAISYLNAFRECKLVAELTKWICNQTGIMDQNAIPDMTNPKALIKWLLVLNDQGVEVFEHSMSAIHAKAVACVSNEPPQLTLRTGNLNENAFDLNEIGECEEPEMGGQSNSRSPGALCLSGANSNAGRKRKDARSGLQEPQVKQVKLDHLGSYLGDTFLSLSHGSEPQSGNLVIDIASDDDMDLAG